MAQAIKYVYNPVDSAGREIRLLVIQPGLWSEEITCRLKTVSLNDGPRYETLSYTWGDNSKEHLIQVDGSRFRVNHNLFLALRRLRSLDEARVIWIDAICINQSDNNEKSAQVAMMGRIYSSCSRATTSSPPESTTAKQAFELLRVLGEDVQFDQLACFTSTEEGILTCETFASHFKSLEAITYIPWWSRIRIVQEMVLPPEVVFAFASETCPYEVIYNMHAVFGAHANSCCAKLWFRFTENPTPACELIIAVNLRHGPLIAVRRRRVNGETMTLSDLRQRFCTFEATQMRDLFYGLLGMVNTSGADLPLVPDYGITEAEAISIACYTSIKQNQNLDIIQGSRWAITSLALPSWIPDVLNSVKSRALAPRERRYRNHLQGQFNASSQPCTSVGLVEGTVLKVLSSWRDFITMVGDEVHDAENVNWQDVQARTLRSWMSALNIHSWPTICPQDITVHSSFWRAIISDSVFVANPNPPFFRRAERQDYTKIYGYLSSLLEDRTSTPDSNLLGQEFNYPIYLSMMDSRFVRTRQGRIGIAPARCQVGDEIHI
ncbi:unnamed protein product [Clonostachys byssicola]|uniref:Heterokaryon incompatibility domain-containing protein n=1 Tax=Clonostachys byssicola TaxID=160290 RepID=A0A9N9V0S0_9HYPO|nr:unnamed protein product [Clonostachys byssicola]